MSVILLRPPEYNTLVESGDIPLIFLAGPIQGAPDWQASAIVRLSNSELSFAVASPRGWQGEYDENRYVTQFDWERDHLEHATLRGVIMFWLAKEVEHSCKRAYAQTSRLELGEALGLRSVHENAKVVVGMEEGFTNERYIRRLLQTEYSKVPLLGTLEEACEHTLSLVKTII